MPDSTSALINQLTNPPNPLNQFGGTVDLANKLMDYKANQAASDAYRQSIDPETGAFDQGKFNSVMQQSPAAMWKFGEQMRSSGVGNQAQGLGTQAQTDAARGQLTMMNGVLTPFLQDAQNGIPVNPEDVKAAIGNSFGLTPQMKQAAYDKLATLGSKDAGPMLKGWAFATQSPEGQATRTMTTTQQNIEQQHWLSEQGWYPDPADPTKQKFGSRWNALNDYGQSPDILNKFIVRGFGGGSPGMGGAGGAGGGAVGGGKGGTPGPQSSAAPGSNQYAGTGNEFLANQRAPIAAELANNPNLRNEVLAMAVTEDKNDPAGPIESLFNRAAYTGQSISSLLHSGFYGPINRGELPNAIASLRDSDLRSRMENGLNTVIAGSNRLQGATDQGGPGDPNADWEGGRITPPGSSPGAIYNDWGGGPGGHEGAAAWRQEQQRRVNAPKPTQVASLPPTTATDAQPANPYAGTGGQGTYVPPGGTAPRNIVTGQPAPPGGVVPQPPGPGQPTNINQPTPPVGAPTIGLPPVDVSALRPGGGAQFQPPPIQLAQSGFPGGFTVTAPIDLTKQVETSRDAFTTARRNYDTLSDRLSNLTQAADILRNNPNLATGTGSEDVQRLENIAQTVLGQKLSPQATTNLAALTELNKDLERYYRGIPGADRSDLSQTEAKMANPSIQMQRDALSDLIAKTIGMERLSSSVYQAFVAQYGGPAQAENNAAHFGALMSGYRNQFDPVGFGADYMNKNQLNEYMYGLPNKQAQDKFWNSILQGEKQYGFKVQP